MACSTTDLNLPGLGKNQLNQHKILVFPFNINSTAIGNNIISIGLQNSQEEGVNNLIFYA